MRKEFDEPRIHFAINCASISCPILRNEAYTAKKLEQQLDDQAFQFINNPIKNNIDPNRTKISKIFDWFQSDFNQKSGLLPFLKNYQPQLNLKNTIEYLDYNWNLNE